MWTRLWIWISNWRVKKKLKFQIYMIGLENPRNGLGWSNAIIGWPVTVRTPKERKNKKERKRKNRLVFFSRFSHFNRASSPTQSKTKINRLKVFIWFRFMVIFRHIYSNCWIHCWDKRCNYLDAAVAPSECNFRFQFFHHLVFDDLISVRIKAKTCAPFSLQINHRISTGFIRKSTIAAVPVSVLEIEFHLFICTNNDNSEKLNSNSGMKS